MQFMSIAPYLITAAVLGVWFVAFGAVVYLSLRETGKRRWCGVVGGLLVLWGVTSFFLTGLAAEHGSGWVPSAFQWPVGFGHGIITTPAGIHVVPHQSSGRVQVYDRGWNFLRGWHVPARGGSFKLALPICEEIEVLTSRGDSRLRYNLIGDLLESSVCSSRDYDAAPGGQETKYIWSWPWMWTLVHPFLALLTVLIGFVVLWIGGQAQFRFGRRRLR